MSTKVTITFCLLCILTISISCKKKDGKELLVGTWKITKLTLNTDPTDLNQHPPACRKDNYIVFSEGGTGTEHIACGNTTVAFTWYLDFQRTHYSRLGGSSYFPPKLEIIELTNKTFVGIHRWAFNGDYYTYTFAKQ
jgi:hypothetical protein